MRQSGWAGFAAAAAVAVEAAVVALAWMGWEEAGFAGAGFTAGVAVATWAVGAGCAAGDGFAAATGCVATTGCVAAIVGAAETGCDAETGFAVARDIAKGLAQPYQQQPTAYVDGADGKQGGVGILRTPYGNDGELCLLMKYSAHGMGHGHANAIVAHQLAQKKGA